MPGSRGEQRRPDPAVITNARQGSTAEFEARRRNYMIAMGLRTLCFLASTILYFLHVIDIWVCAIIFAAAVVLPSVAVAAANQAHTRHDDDVTLEGGGEMSNARQITTGEEPEVVSGTVEDDEGPVPGPHPFGQARDTDQQHRGAA